MIHLAGWPASGAGAFPQPFGIQSATTVAGPEGAGGGQVIFAQSLYG